MLGTVFVCGCGPDPRSHYQAVHWNRRWNGSWRALGFWGKPSRRGMKRKVLERTLATGGCVLIAPQNSLRIPKEVSSSGSLRLKDNTESRTAVCIYTDGWTTSQQLPTPVLWCSWLDFAYCLPWGCPSWAAKSTCTPPTLGLPAFTLLKVI